MIILVMIPLNRFIAVKIGAATKELMIHKDARIKLMTECFRSIKSIKMSGLETTMSARSMIHRENELKYLSQRKYLDAWCVFLWASLPLLVPYITFVTTVAALNRQLTASEVFTTIALLNMLIFPMNAYPWIINGAVEASVSIRRLSSVLIVPPYSPDDDNSETHLDLGVLASKEIKHMTSPSSEIDDFHEPSRKKSALSTLFGGQSDDQLTSAELLARSGDRNSHSLIDVKDLLISWNEEMIGGVPPSRSSSRESSSSDRLLDRKLVLKDSNFVVGPITLKSILPGQVIGICGSVGSGKTTLFMGLLSECYTSSSSSESVLKASVSYCSQNPRLHAGTVRTNVCFESPYRRERYYLIMKGCCLDEDFCLYEKSLGDEIGSSYGMDEEDIGQGGSRLSGGQRLRVGIARSLYSTSGIVLLDDPFSALDRNTAQRLMSFIVALATREKRVILLVTNEIHMLKTGVSRIIFLSNGRVVGSGSYQELYESHESFRNMIEKTVENIVWSESMEVESSSLLPEDEETGKKGGKGQKSEFGHEEDSEHMGRGEIEGKVYRAYFRAAGFGVVALVLSATLLMQVLYLCSLFPDLNLIS